MSNKVEEWEDERKENIMANVFQRTFDEILEIAQEDEEGDTGFYINVLADMSERFSKLVKQLGDSEISENMFYELLNNPWIDILDDDKQLRRIEWESNRLPYMDNLFVPKRKDLVIRQNKIPRVRGFRTEPMDFLGLLILSY
jgi:hypothetical protein